MASKTTFIVQTFELEAMSARLPGTAAVCITADDETGEIHAATILGTFGEIPDDFAGSLLG